ncbi:MAG TPA: 16S rRNA (cytidine(1402)-2'-O)-methyltransferase [Thermotogota bacterium]|nr:16S rRNA (cytidine(1402)-2'-O)-methyltransferase [Thermotogota bacterium]HPJ89604.1 16S rRNA (cytidine(1402)-2'-O)-methyltransferase [Thermotogota bacterium]HPR96787.1 16S rRNA (cytidine(1402)-2'-O)-methyltransferase [Thermotogota bacterium]
MNGKLIVAGTPIGNMEDCTVRVVNALKTCDFILAEDTRRTIQLLNMLEIGKKEIISFSQQKERLKAEQIIPRIKNGEKAVIVSDAGMPCVSDPGSYIISLCHKNDIEVDVLPGPSAVTVAYAASGFGGSFIFEGFVGRDKKFRRFIRSVAEEKRNIIFYESPFRLNKCLKDIFEILGNREIFVAREMTKIHQEYFRGTCEEAIEYFKGEVKGELTVIIRGAEQDG